MFRPPTGAACVSSFFCNYELCSLKNFSFGGEKLRLNDVWFDWLILCYIGLLNVRFHKDISWLVLFVWPRRCAAAFRPNRKKKTSKTQSRMAMYIVKKLTKKKNKQNTDDKRWKINKEVLLHMLSFWFAELSWSMRGGRGFWCLLAPTS